MWLLTQVKHVFQIHVIIVLFNYTMAHTVMEALTTVYLLSSGLDSQEVKQVC